jgi:ABC-2 type transport system permease protein
MRALIVDETFRGDLMLKALALNLVYFTAGFLTFLRFFDASRRAGSILQVGE